MMRTAVTAVVAVMLLALPAGAQDVERLPDRRRQELANFMLFTGCDRMRVVTYVQIGDDGEDYGVTEERVGGMAESRLRAARLYGAPLNSFSALSVTVWFSGRAYFTEVGFVKTLTDPISGREEVITTWTAERLGTHGGDGNYVMQGVSEQVDRFILEFLRENEEACRSREDP